MIKYGIQFAFMLVGGAVIFYSFFGLFVPWAVVEMMKPSLERMIDTEINRQASELIEDAIKKEISP